MNALPIALAFLLLSGLSAATPTGSVANLRIATFNVNGGYNDEGGPWSERLPAVVETMLQARASIYLIQEAHEENNEHRQVLAELKRQSHSRWRLIVGDGGNHFIVDGGKYRLLGSVRTTHLPHRRDYSEVNLQHVATGTKFWIWNTHLTAKSADLTTEEAQAIRREQAEAIMVRLSRLHRVVGGGDINEFHDMNVRAILADVGHNDVRTRTTDVTNGGWDSHEFDYQPNLMRGRWIDPLFVGDLTSVNSAGLIDSENASDHNLIWASVSIPKDDR